MNIVCFHAGIVDLRTVNNEKSNTTFFCPGDNDALFLQCDVYISTFLRWRVLNATAVFLDTSTPAFSRNEKFSVVLDRISTNVGVSNFSSFLWFYPNEIKEDNILVHCESFDSVEQIVVKPSGECTYTHACTCTCMYICTYLQCIIISLVDE